MPEVQVFLRGAVWELRSLLHGPGPYPEEAVLEGPAGTGKTRGLGHVLYEEMLRWPKLRIAVCRKTRASLTQTFLKTWEEDVLPEGDAMLSGASRSHREEYRVPWNDSVLVPVGLDNPGRHYSSDWDIVCCIEAWELTLDEWERWFRALRNGRAPYGMVLGDLNPQWPEFWLHKRCDAGVTKCFFSKHVDNPAHFDEDGVATPRGERFMRALNQLSGVRRLRLLDGKRVAAEGQVWPQFRHDLHMVSFTLRHENAMAYLDRPATPEGLLQDPIELRWFFASVDWGTTAPGCLQVWGVDAEKTIYRVVEIYTTGKILDWWAERAAELHKEFRLRAIVCDPSRNDSIIKFNDRLGSRGERDTPRLAFGADNKLITSDKGDLGGLDQVRWALEPGIDEKGKAKPPRMYFLRNALRHGPDPERVAASMPTCTEEEIPAYVLLKAALGREDDKRAQKDERPDPTCEDHGCDAMRYAATYVWSHNFKPIKPVKVFKPGTNAHMHGTPASLEREARKRQREDGW